MADHDKLYYTVQLELDTFKKQMSKFESQLSRMRGETQKTSSQMQDSFNKIGKGVAGFFSVEILKGFAHQVINVRGQMQQMEKSLTTMLKSHEKSAKLITELTETASNTPFDMKGITEAATKLLAYGSTAEDVNNEIIKLGDIAAGVSMPLGELVYLYGTTRTQGKVFLKDIQQFLGRGIPIVEELAKSLNVAESEIYDMVSDGKIGFAEVQEALFRMSSEGGKFFNLMQEQSSTLTGRLSRLQDTIDSMFNNIGESVEGPLNKSIDLVNTLAENYETVAKVIGVLVATYGTYNAAVKLNVALQSEGAIRKAINNIVSMTNALRGAKTAQQAFNVVCSVNPYVMAATAIVGAISYILLFTNVLNKQAAAQEVANESISKAIDSTENYKSSLNSLISVIDDETKAQWRRVEAYNALSKASKAFEGISFDEFVSMDEVSRQNLLDKAAYDKKIEELKKEQYNLLKRTEGSGNKSVWDKIRNKVNIDGVEYETLSWEEYFIAEKEILKKIDEETKIYQNSIRERNKAITESASTIVKNKKYYEDLLKEENEKWENLSVEERESKRSEYEKTVSNLEEIIKGWERTEQKVKDLNEKQKEYNDALLEYKRLLTELSTEGLTTYEAEKARAKAKLDETLETLRLQKSKGIDTTEGENKAQQRYDLDIEEIERKKADEISSIYRKLDAQLSTTEKNRIDDINNEYEKLFDNVKKNFTSDEAIPLVKELEKARDLEVELAKIDARAARDSKTFNLEKIRIQTDYNNGLISEIEYQERILENEIKQQEAIVTQLQQQALQINNEEILSKLTEAQAQLELLHSQKNTYRSNSTGIFSDNKDKYGKNIDRINGSIDLLSTITDSLSQIEGELGNIFSSISEAAQSLGNSFSAISSGDKMAMAQAAVQGTVDLINVAVQSVQEYKKAREEWRKQEIKSQNNLAKIKLDSMNYEEGIFGDVDKEEKLISLIDKRKAVQTELNKSIEKLQNEGQVKIGTKKVVDAGTVLKATGIGTGAGAALGTMIFPGIGTAIGAAAGALTGAIVGIFSKETTDVYDSLISQYGNLIDERTMTLNEKLLADYDKLDDATKAMVDNAKELLATYNETKKEYEEQISQMYGDIKQELSDSLASAFRDNKVYSAIDDFKSYLGKRVSEILQAKAFERFFGPVMDGVEKIATQGIDSTEQIAIQIAKVQNALTTERLNSYNETMKGYEEVTKKMFGLDIKGTDSEQQDVYSGAISSMSEDTANEINGNFYGLKLSAMEINGNIFSMRESLNVINNIMSLGLEYQRRTADNTDIMVDELRIIRRDGISMR